MNDLSMAAAAYVYFPATVCRECDSPIDALQAACVGQREAMDLVVASWSDPEACCLLAKDGGGRYVLVIRLAGGRWAACHPWLAHPYRSHRDAERCVKQSRRHRCRGIVVRIAFSLLVANGMGDMPLVFLCAEDGLHRRG